MSESYIKALVDIHSPSGFTEEVIDFISESVKSLPFTQIRTRKGALLVSSTESPQLVISGHIDTLGGMVKHIRDDGTLELTQLGGWPPNSFEGEHVTVRTHDGKHYRGTFLLNNPAAHVNREITKTERDMTKMHVRVDALISSGKDAREAGIRVGDFVFFDPRFEVTDTGFIKSRFLDDKACAGVMLDILLNHFEEIKTKNVGFFFSNYEEVGHGSCAGIPVSVEELLVADMGVVGDQVAGKETAVSICAKDSSGPYDFTMRETLIRLARENDISHEVDVFPYYGSDGSAALRAGMDARVGLIGPGVASSHGVERTHLKGVKATKDLILAYIKNAPYNRQPYFKKQ